MVNETVRRLFEHRLRELKTKVTKAASDVAYAASELALHQSILDTTNRELNELEAEKASW